MMQLKNRYLVFGGTNLKEEYGLQYSSFEEELPEPKVVKIEIPGGTDIDVTDSLGAMAYSNGTHTLRFLLYGDTEAERLAKKRAIISKVHGVMADYQLSWEDATYRGRGKVSVEHLFDNADLVTIEIDRTPWKTSGLDSIDINCAPTGTASLDGSMKYADVEAVLQQDASISVSGGASTSYSAGTVSLADELVGDQSVTATVDDWVVRFDEPSATFNQSKFSVDGDDAVVDSPYTVADGDIDFTDEAKQHVTVQFYRKDI